MSMAGLEAFDRTVHPTDEWVPELMDKVMLRHVSEGQIDQGKHAMPAELEELWS